MNTEVSIRDVWSALNDRERDCSFGEWTTVKTVVNKGGTAGSAPVLYGQTFFVSEAAEMQK